MTPGGQHSPTGQHPQLFAWPGTYLRRGERLQLAQALQHALHVVLQGPHGAGHVGVHLQQQPLAPVGKLRGALGILRCPSKLRICRVQRRALLRQEVARD